MTFRTYVLTAAVALGVGCGGCGGEDGAAILATPAEVITASANAGATTAARPNILGGGGDVTRLLGRLDADLTSFMSETLEPTGARIEAARVERSARSCDGRRRSADEAPRWCEAEHIVYEPVAGAEQVRAEDGEAALYVLVGWAHAESIGSQLGWHDAVRRGKLAPADVAEAQTCLLWSWIIYTVRQGLVEDADWESIGRAFDRPVFDSVDSAAINRAFDTALDGGSDACGRSGTASVAAAATPAPPDDSIRAFTAPAPAATSARAADGGRVVASSGFDTTRDGFAFPNYGENGGPMLRAAEIRELFGTSVCVDPSAARCVLTAVADQWRTQQNDGLANGHCYGFSLLSLDLFHGPVLASRYGAATTHELRIADLDGTMSNPELAADLARDAVEQSLASVQRRARRFTPTELVQELLRSFRAGQGEFVLSMWMAGEGGHAVVPVGVIDRGDGKYDIQLYDNNFPATPLSHASDRRLHIDTAADTWEYDTGLRPDTRRSRWHGQGRDNRLWLTPAAAHALPQPCPFCDGAGAGAPTTITLAGHPELHGHLRITDAEGHVTGYAAGRLVNDIPGARIVQPQVLQRQFVRPEPMYEVPSGRAYTVELVDVPAGAPAQSIHATGPGLGVGLAGVTAEGATLRLGQEGAVTVRDAGGEPRLSAAVGEDQVRLVPDADRVRLDTGSHGRIRISGEVESATARDPATGRTTELEASG